MSYTLTLVPHKQTIDLRLLSKGQMLSYTLPLLWPIKEKTLQKLKKSCNSRFDSALTDEVLRQVQLQLPQLVKRQLGPQQSNVKSGGLQVAQPQATLTGLPSTLVVCDYSAQQEKAVWACVIGTAPQQVLCCGLVPYGKQGESYAIRQTHYYLQRLGYSGTIFSDEKYTVEKLKSWFLVDYIDRSHVLHRPAHHLAHNFALLVAGKPGVCQLVAELAPLLEKVWPDSEGVDFIYQGTWKMTVHRDTL